MIKKLIFLMVVFLVLVLPVLSLSFDSNKTVAGKDRLIDGSLVFQKGIYEKNSKVKLTLDGNLAEKTISELISCTGSCKEVSSNSYSYTGATATEISSTNFLTGISIKRGSTISIDAKFNISNGDSSYPETPMIDVGDDGIIEWKFQGRAPTSIDWNVNSYQGPSINDAGATELNLDPS